MEIRPWDRLLEALPPLASYEFEALKASIAEHGVLQRLLILPDGRIIDGYHRWKIAPDAPYDILNLDDETAFLLGLAMNVARRQMSPDQIKELRKKQKKMALELRNTGMSQEKVAGILGVPEGTIAWWEAEVKKDISILGTKDTYTPPDLRIKVAKKEKQKIAERVTAGESQSQIAADFKITQPRVSQIVKQKKTSEASIPLLPPGKFDVIYADPPWRYEFSETEPRSIEAHYDTLSLEEICSYKDGNGTPVQDKIADNAVLFLWATQPKIREALQVIKDWGFEYRTGAVWVKDKIGMGYYFREQHELLFVAKKGDMSVPPPEARPSSVIRAPRTKHSQKPKKVHKIIEKMYPRDRYLEIFGREKYSDKWQVWGLEVKGGG